MRQVFQGQGVKSPALSFCLGLVVSVLIIAPNIPYKIPIIANPNHWCFLAVLAGFFGVLIWKTEVHWILKILSVYLFVTCFFSQAPYPSFNSYILFAAGIWFYWALLRADFKIVINLIEAAFWLEIILVVLQLMGKDSLLNFGAAIREDAAGNLSAILMPDARKPVFFGTVMQYMRFSSLLAVLTPFLLSRSRWYVVPIMALCALSQSSSFAMSIIAGFFTYGFLCVKDVKRRALIVAACLAAAGAYAAYDWGSFRGAIIPSNGGRLISWLVILKTWCLDTAGSSLVDPWGITGAFKWQWFLFGHGIDTFLPLFPIYKHDMNPFPQAHNSWLQFLWEIGYFGLQLVAGYCASLYVRLLKAGAHDLVAGLTILAVNMFFAFPDRMTQTILLLVAYLAFCESALKEKSRWA